jgi:hypothetical protein
LELLNSADKLSVVDVLKDLLVFGIVSLPALFNTEQVLDIIDVALRPLQPPTDGLPLLVYCYVLALLYDLISNVGSKVVCSEVQKWADFIDCPLDGIELLP